MNTKSVYGIICNDDINKVGHSLFLNFRMAMHNILDCTFVNILTPYHIVQYNLKTVFIVDEHYDPNVKLWRNPEFISIVNTHNVHVIVFNFERIYNSSFPWNIEHQQTLEKINKLTQFVSDIDDAKKMNKPVINKQFLSTNTILEVEPVKEKINKVLFIGQVNDYYPTRKKVIEQASKILDMDVVVTDRKLLYSDFLKKLNQYKYVFNPLGTGKFLNLRFYEAIKLGCIPIQEVREDMVPYYKELMHCITFTNPKEINFDKTIVKYDGMYTLEDHLKDIKLMDYIE